MGRRRSAQYVTSCNHFSFGEFYCQLVYQLKLIFYFNPRKLQILKAICELPESIMPFVYQVIEMSTNVNDPSTVYLLEEGLELWLVVVQYTPTVNEALFKLCDNLLPIIGE